MFVLDGKVQTKRLMSDEYKNSFTNFDNALFVGTGVESFLFSADYWTPNVVSVNPATPLKSKINKTFELPKLYENFISQYESVILISFGTTVVPTEKDFQ
jgi:hypothetical protein